MTIAGKRYKLDKYCSDTTCSQCIFNKGAEGCKYHFLDDEDCIKAYDELMAKKDYSIAVEEKRKKNYIMSIEEKRNKLRDYCDDNLCIDCIFYKNENGCRYDCDFDDDEDCERAYDELMAYKKNVGEI